MTRSRVGITWRVIELAASPRAPWAVHALSDVQREVELATWGWTDLWARPEVWQGTLDDRDYTERLLFLAIPDGLDISPHGELPAAQVAAAAVVHLPLAGNRHLALLQLLVRPGRRRAGAGTALLRHVEREVGGQGRTTLVAWASHRPEPAPGPGALDPATGAGRIPADAPATRFAQHHGFTLEQVSRYSVQAVPEDLAGIIAMRESAVAQAGPDYRLHTWHDVVPEQWHAQLGALEASMATDSPTGALEFEAEPWDAARVRRWLRSFADRHQHVTITAAEHVPSATLVGYTILIYPMTEQPFAFQDSTIVVAAHRGHRLGMAVKATNLVATRERRPGLARVHTDNAQENAPMLAINVALGYTPVGVIASWQKRL
jgi:GNAT superfamily N-acetyltransferase